MNYSQKVIEEGNELVQWYSDSVENRNVSEYVGILKAYNLIKQLRSNHKEDTERYKYLNELVNYLDQLPNN